MLIDTTLHVNNCNMLKLLVISRKTGKTKRYIISSLLKRLADDHLKLTQSRSRIKYQDRGTGVKWHRVHVLLNCDEYEFFLDLRKFCKQSVSRLVSYALDTYLHEMENELCENNDNYRYRNYITSKMIVDGVVCWVLYWGIPKRLITNPYHS